MPILKKNEVRPLRPVIMVIYGTPGTGKAQPVWCNVLTPNGFVKLSELKVGDKVIDPTTGLEQVVEGIFPQGIRPVYKITTNDGLETFSDEEHIWNVRHRGGNSYHAGFRNFTLKQLIDKGIRLNCSDRMKEIGKEPFCRWELPITKPIDFAEKEYVIHPYLLGVLIGDGCLTGTTIGFSNTDNDSEISTRISSLIDKEYHLSKNKAPSCPFYNISKKDRYAKKTNIYSKAILDLGLNVKSKDKFIPDIYKLGSKEQRIELLRGLMDTDGTSHHGRISFSTTSKSLSLDVAELVQSLGGIARVHAYDRDDEGKSIEYNISININIQPFYLKRKACNWKERNISRYISEVKRVDDCECVCIKVSGENELYLTDNFIVTHNTSLANTSENPLLIDCDRGFDRAANQVDTLTAQTWEDVLNEEPSMKGYKTIIVDTAKSMLDDFLSVYGVKQDYKLAKNKLKLFGYIADEFKSFVNRRRSDLADIIFVCHDKETQEGDIIRHSPDCTGQSKDLLLRIADQVGFITMVNGKRTICFDPTDTTIGKNVAHIPVTTLPDCNSSDFSHFMADIIGNVKRSIQSKTEEQRKAMEALEQANIALEAVATVEDANRMIEIKQSLDKVFEKPFKAKMVKVLDEKGFVFDKSTNQFVVKDEKKAC